MNVDVQISRADHLIRRGRYAEAVEMLHEVLVDEPDSMPALLNLGIAYTESGQNDEAIRALTFYISRDDANAEAWEALGCAHLRKSDFADAERALDRARVLNPENGSVLRNLAVLLGRTGRARASLYLLRKAHAVNPYDYLTTYALALATRQFGRFDESRALFDEVAETEHAPAPVRDDARRNEIELTLGWT